MKNGQCVFETPLGRLGATYTVHLRLIMIVKLVVEVDFLFELTELFFAKCDGRGAANIDWKSAFLKGASQFWPIFT